MFRAVIAAALWAVASFLACGAFAANKPTYGPPAPWVRPAALPAAGAPPSGAAVQALLWDRQIHFDANGAETYVEIAFRILT
ncbi:MAG: DUF3857 domain-containing protein, partial [Caulobacteraceae bacterium]